MFSELKPYGERGENGLPAGWMANRLASLGRVFKANGGSKDDDAATGVPCVRYGDLYTKFGPMITRVERTINADRARAYTGVKRGDVLFAASGETEADIGRSAVVLVDDDVVAGGDIIVFRPRVDVDPGFLGLTLDSARLRSEKARRATGTMIVHISPGAVKTLTIPVPPRDEQVAIVKYLAHAHRRIERAITAKQELIELLEEYERAATEDVLWCAPARPAEVSVLGRHVDILAGYPFPSEGFTSDENDVRLLRGVNVSPGGVEWSNAVRWPEERAANLSRYALGAGDIVLGMDRPLISAGVRVAQIEEKDLPALLLQRVARLRPRPTITAKFLLGVLRSQRFIDYLRPIFTGVSVPHLSPEQIRRFPLAVPALEAQREAVEAIDRVTAAVRREATRARREINLLEEFRIRLTADVVTGQLDVQEAAARLFHIDLSDDSGKAPEESANHLADEATEFLEVVDA